MPWNTYCYMKTWKLLCFRVNFKVPFGTRIVVALSAILHSLRIRHQKVWYFLIFQEYLIRVQRGPTAEQVWHVFKRYNDFVGLHHALQSSNLLLPLPPKKLIGNFDKDFIAERQIGLQVQHIQLTPHPTHFLHELLFQNFNSTHYTSAKRINLNIK